MMYSDITPPERPELEGLDCQKAMTCCVLRDMGSNRIRIA